MCVWPSWTTYPRPTRRCSRTENSSSGTTPSRPARPAQPSESLYGSWEQPPHSSSAGAVAAALARTTTTAVTLASLTAFISALGGYVSSTLLATYRVSVEQARHYFREPLAGGYLLAAEHLAATLDAPERATALGRVVDGFIQAATNVPGAAQDSAPSEEPPGATSALS
ncbi:hypothetical protein AB0M86_43230 [Streptomyces sp. NPDC051639]|uniref:hypothetical protein n=1 Tax=Streptomyces sp. NPDC051639 TaxID=3155671 RepID=UPI00344933C6